MARTLAREAAGWFFAATMTVQLVALAGTGSLLLGPIVRVSTDNLAALMTRVATEYAKAPLAQRSALAAHWQQAEHLAVGGEKRPGKASWLPYNYFLANALSARAGQPIAIEVESTGTDTLYRASLPTPQGDVVVRFSHERIGTQPTTTLLILIAGSLLASLVPPLWLARRLTGPLAILAEGAERVGRGDTSVRLPESGPVELTRLISAFNRMAGDLDQLVRQRTTMLAGISHDLRTPIARCRMALELLKTERDPKLIENMERYLADMNALIASFMEFAKEVAADSGPLVPLPQLLDDVASSVDNLIIQAGPHPEIPLHAMRRVLTNLIDNARHHGGGKVELALYKAGATSVLEIRDQGPGIATEQMEAMFEPFVRGDAARTTPGSGLGLAIVRQLCRANGWEIQLSQRHGGGLTARLVMTNHEQRIVAHPA